MRIKARSLLNYTTDQLWDILTGTFILVFDDGIEITTTDRMTLYSSYFWDFHRLYIKTPLLVKHHAQTLLSKENLSSKTHIELLKIIYWDTINADTSSKLIIKNSLIKLIYSVTNNLYNSLIVKTEANIMSIDIMDFIELDRHPGVETIFKNLESTPDSIEKAYKSILKIINEDKAIADNSLVRAVKSKMVNSNQVLQCIGPRGFVSEVDGAIMVHPVERSYTQGMRSQFNILAESRTAAKSLYFSESPLQDSEYFSRRLQLICMSVEKIYRGDCKTNNYLTWFVKPAVKRLEREIYPGDLKFLIGKYYIDRPTGTIKAITIDDKHLIGTFVELRSVLKCIHSNPHEVCEICFGQMSENISDFSNLGHVCAANMTQQTTQSVLSTKHLDASSTSDPIKFTSDLTKFFVETEKKRDYILKPDLKNLNLTISIASNNLYGFTDILRIDNIQEIDPSRISDIDSIAITIGTVDNLNPTEVKISQNGRKAIITREFIKYTKVHKWTINSAHAYVFDMSQWDYKLPIFRLPDVEYSFSMHSKKIAELIESNIKSAKNRNLPTAAVDTLIELFDTVNSKISVNIALLEVIMYAMMVRNNNTKDMSLARNSPTATLGVRDEIIKLRSLSATYGFEDQIRVLTSPTSFFPNNRPDHPLDVFFCPGDVLNNK